MKKKWFNRNTVIAVYLITLPFLVFLLGASCSMKEEYALGDEIGLLGKELSELTAASAKEKKALAGYKTKLDKMNQKIRDTKIDPNRYLGNMNAFARVMTILGAMLGGYTEGLSRGRIKNRAFDLINAGIKRDIAAQKMELEKMMNERNYTATERKWVYSKWRALERDKKVAALRKSKMVLAKIGLESQRAEDMVWAAGQLDRLDKEEERVLYEGKVKARDVVRKSYTGRRTTTTRFLTPKFAKAGKVGKSEAESMGAEDKKKFAAAFNVPKIFDRIMDVAKKFEQAGRWQGGLKSWVGRGELRAEVHQMIQDVIKKVREMSGVAARPDEHKKLEYGFDTRFRTKAGAIVTIRGFARRSVSDLRARAAYHRDMGQPNVAARYDSLANKIIKRVNKEIKFWGYKPWGVKKSGVKSPKGTKGQ